MSESLKDCFLKLFPRGLNPTAQFLLGQIPSVTGQTQLFLFAKINQQNNMQQDSG